MRNLVALATLLAFAPLANAADGKGEFSMNGEYRIRYQFDQAWKTADKDADTNRSTVYQRFKVDTGFRASEKFSAQLSLLANSILGNFNSSGDSGTAIPDGTGDGQNMVLVNQAYGMWMINDTWSLKFGRGGFTSADGSVISQNDWQNTPYAFDGILANMEKENFRLGIFAVKAIDAVAAQSGGGYTAPNGNDDPEANFYGLAFDWKALPEFLKTANVHVMQVNKDLMGYTTLDTAYNAGKSEMRYGVVLAGDMSNFDYKLNYAAHNGEAKTGVPALPKVDLSGMMYAVELGYSMPDLMKSRFHVGYHSDSGDKNSAATDDKSEEYDTFYYEKHGTSGLMDVVAWGNLTFIKAGYTLSPADNVDVGLHYWMFETTEKGSGGAGDASANAGNNGGIITTSRSATNDATELGSEIDLAVTKKYDGGLSISAWLGMFMPGKYVKNELGKDDTYNQIFVEGKMTF